MNGKISRIDIKSFLSMLSQDGLSCEVKIFVGNDTGVIHLIKGHPADASYLEWSGTRALLELLALDKTDVEVDRLGGDIVARNRFSMDVLLLEAAKIQDEASTKIQLQADDLGLPDDEDFQEPMNNSQPQNGENMITSSRIQELLKYLKNEAGDGLLGADIFSSADGQSLGGINGGNAKACALFSQITTSLIQTMTVGGFAKIKDYYMLNLKNNTTIFVIILDQIEISIAINNQKTKLGLMLNLVIPGLLKLAQSP